jgi:hypothetical protein
MRLGAEVDPGGQEGGAGVQPKFVCKIHMRWVRGLGLKILTNNPKDIPDCWHTDDKYIDQNQQDQGYGHVPWPAEGLAWEEQLLQGPADLWPGKGRTGVRTHMRPLLQVTTLHLRSLLPLPAMAGIPLCLHLLNELPPGFPSLSKTLRPFSTHLCLLI